MLYLPIQAHQQVTHHSVLHLVLQYQQMAQQIQQAIAKKPLIQPYPQDPLPRGPVTTAVTPMNNSYDERDIDELVMHRRENPLKPRDLKNWGFDSKSHFKQG